MVMEMNKKNFVFQIDSKEVRDEYKKNNFLIDYNEYCVDKSLCVIYFSSNDIYYPNKEEVFKKVIVEKNNFEWYNIRVKKAYKHIFLRDIQKQWYIEGINKDINTPELLYEFLLKETVGYTVITIGSSAGGYAAVLYGSLLSAKRILTFNGQFEIKSLLSISSYERDPLIFRKVNDSVAKYYDLKSIIEINDNVYYFVSLNSNWDISQYNYIRDISQIKVIGFRTSHHGIPFLKSALPFVVNLIDDDLNKLSSKIYFPLVFSIKILGVIKTVVGFVQQMYRKYKKRK